jgi:hypothetical protein
MATVGRLISKYQITNGGNVILWQPENEYSGAAPGFTFPDPAYMQYLETQARDAGIAVPFVNNDAWTRGYQAPGTGKGAGGIYVRSIQQLQAPCSYIEKLIICRATTAIR